MLWPSLWLVELSVTKGRKRCCQVSQGPFFLIFLMFLKFLQPNKCTTRTGFLENFSDSDGAAHEEEKAGVQRFILQPTIQSTEAILLL